MALYEEFEPQPNRLINAESSYLRSAAYQPVGWYEFSPEAFAEAQRQDKPILLDIGAVWCHWCHVIDRESYDDPEIATYLNELYIPVKVDRDERPDIDTRYQMAVQLLTGQGGWPLTVFLTPDGEPFYGGTYFPPEDSGGRVGFKTLLPKIADTYQHRRHELTEVARTLDARVREANVSLVENGPLSEELFTRIARGISARFHRDTGGFERSGPKFPHAGAIELALLQYDVTGEDRWRTIAETTLTAMGRGGIYDQLGGGFHRYATDANWIVPHFEKMGYDNALLLVNYIHAYRATGNDFFRTIAEGTLDFIFRELADKKRGGFYSSQDADVNLNDDGSYWTWSFAEFVEALMPEDVPVMTRYYGVRREGDMPGTGRNVLHLAETPEEIANALKLPLEEVEDRIERGKRRLQEVRSKRRTPPVDTNTYAGWNAMLASACLEAGTLLGLEDVTEFGLRTVDVLLNDAYEPDHGIYHGFHGDHGARLPGFFEDQIYTAQALLDAFAVSGRYEHLQTARRLLDLGIEQYWDQEHGGFLDMAREQLATEAVGFLNQPRKTIQDLPTPAANAVAALVLDRMWLLTHDEQYHDYARQVLETFAAHAPDFGPFAATYGLAVYFHLHPSVTVTIVGEWDDSRTRQLWQAALATYRPGLQVAMYPPVAEYAHYPVQPDRTPAAYLCVANTCAEPITDPEELANQLQNFGKE